MDDEADRSHTPSRGSKRRKFCSLRCQKRAAKKGTSRSHTARARQHGCARRYNVDVGKVLARDRWRCQLCGCATPSRLRGSTHERAPELDHIVPLSLGGAHTYDNVQCACRLCNITKGATWRGQSRLPLEEPPRCHHWVTHGVGVSHL